MRTKCKRNHCSYSRRMLQGTAPLRSLSEKSENGCAAMTSLLNECCKKLQKTAVKATLGEKQKHAALSLLLPVADLDAVRARKVMARRLPNGRTQNKKRLLRKENKRQSSPSNISRSRFKSLRRRAEKRNNFAFGISSKLVCRQAEQKARRGIPKTVQACGKIFTPQTITSRRFFKHDLYSDERSPTKKAFPLCQNKGSKHY